MKAGRRKITMDDEEEAQSSRSCCVFRGIEYVVSAQTANNGRSLVVEVEDKLTADQWRGKFDAAYIEDMTRKTGNFKQFPVFVAMLESALQRNSDSVVLDLLTYSDLELLRNRKVGKAAKPLPNSHAQMQQNKRYLILIYSVAFDRIHYPLPLPYQGKPDPVHLQNLVRQLNDEIRRLKTSHIGLQDEDHEQLKEEYEVLLREKTQLEIELDELRGQMKQDVGMAVSKEVRVLKKVVQNLELEMVKEKNKFQRIVSKKTAEVKRLTNDLQETETRERSLQIRVKSLMNELAMLKKMRTPTSRRPSTAGTSMHSQRTGTRLADRSASSINRSGMRSRSISREGRSSSVARERSLSKDRRPLSVRNSSRTPTPRFNPTDYIEEKKRKQRESQERRKRRAVARLTPGSGESYRGRSRVRSGTLAAARLSASKESYLTDRRRVRSSSRDSRRSSAGSVTRSNQRRSIVAWEDSPVNGNDSSLRRRSSTPDDRRYQARKTHAKNREHQDYDVNMAEIDARLNALQQYMQELGAGD